MKKITTICLIILTLLCYFTACNEGTKANNISISDLETALKGSDDEFKFAVNEDSNGFSFEYIKDTFVSDVTYSGSADKKQNVTDVTIVYNDISNDIITNKSKMSTALSHLLSSPGSVTLGEAKATECFIDLMSIHVALGVENSNTDTILDIICENKTVEINGWLISVKSEGSTVTITMN